VSAEDYQQKFVALFGNNDEAHRLYLELVVLLPVPDKREELLKYAYSFYWCDPEADDDDEDL